MDKQKVVKIISNNWIQFLLFSGLLWLIFVHLHINRYIDDIITGPHYWRKSDTYAQIMNYYYNGLNFFDHSLYFNQMTTNGKAVAEFPLIYWLIALQMKIFGPSTMLIKINYIVLMFIGLFSLFKIAYYFTKNYVFSLGLGVILFLSPVFTSYSIAYLPDPLAFYLILIGLWCLIKYNTKQKYLIVAIVLISVAGMIKPFFLIPYLALLCTMILNKLWLKNKSIKFNWLFLIPLLMVGLWFLYTNWYNAQVKSDYFLSKARPIWNYDDNAIHKTWTRIINRWLAEYLNPKLLWILLSLIITNIVWWQKKYILHQLFYIFSVLGSFIFVILFYNMFEHHDYYIFPILFLLPLTIGFFIFKLINFINQKIVLNALGFIMLVFVFFGLNYTFSVLESRRKTPLINSKYMFKNYMNKEYFLIKNKVKPNDLIIAFSDKSPSFALTLLKRKGWSGYQTQLHKNSNTIQTLIDKGASVLVINKNAQQNKTDSLIIDPFLNYPIDNINNIYLYNLKPYLNNE